jgi:putative transposase
VSFLPAPLKRQISCGLHRLRHGFLLWTRPTRHSLFAGALTDLARTRSELIAENALLRQHLIVLRRQVNRPVCTKKEQVLLGLPRFGRVKELGN